MSETLVGNQSLDSNDIKEAETVNAPYYDRLPIVFECKMSKHDVIHFEADVLKVSVSEMVLDTDGKVDLSMMLAEMTWFCE